MTDSQLEEFRYDIAYALLKEMSKGSQFQFALDRMLELLADKTEEQLVEMAPAQVIKEQKPKVNRKAKGF